MTIFWNADAGISPTSDAVNVNTPGVWAVVKANSPVATPPPTPSPSPSPSPTQSPTPSPTPQGTPCVELVNGVMTLGVCVGTFTPTP